MPRNYNPMRLDDPILVSKRKMVDADAYRKRHGFPMEGHPAAPASLATPWNETIKALRLEREAQQAQEAAEFAAFMARTQSRRPGSE